MCKDEVSVELMNGGRTGTCVRPSCDPFGPTLWTKIKIIIIIIIILTEDYKVPPRIVSRTLTVGQ